MCTLNDKIKDAVFSIFLLTVAFVLAGLIFTARIKINEDRIETLAQKSQVIELRKQIHFLQKTVADHRMEEH